MSMRFRQPRLSARLPASRFNLTPPPARPFSVERRVTRLAGAASESPRAPSAKRPWIGEACRNEFLTLCRQLPNDSRREAIVECLKAHPESLSHLCTEAMSEGQEQTHVAHPGRGAGPASESTP